MTDPLHALRAQLEDRFQAFSPEIQTAVGQITMSVSPEHWFEVCQVLRDEPNFSFEQLIDLCGVDYLAFGRGEWETSETATSVGFSRGVERGNEGESLWTAPRFAVAAQLLSIKNNQRLRLKSFIDVDPPRLSSVVEIWSSANWFEREAFDLFGILFEGHPDLRRILTDYGFVGHPFRKDFPLIGYVEMRYDSTKGRVVYEPVSIEPRVLVPRVVRRDGRYEEGEVPEQATTDNA